MESLININNKKVFISEERLLDLYAKYEHIRSYLQALQTKMQQETTE